MNAATDSRSDAPGRGGAASGTGGRGGFSLLEVVLVMGAVGILLAAVVPSLIQQLDELARRQEAEKLTTITAGLREHVLDQRRIPGPATAFADVAGQLGWPPATVAGNARGNARVLLVDPALQVGTNTAATLPYVQGLYGAATLAGTRMLVVSSLGAALPAIMSSPGTNATRVFDLLWNAPEATEPDGWTWGGTWNDILIQRLNLRPLFAQVVLNNNSPFTGRFSVDVTNSHVALPSNPYSSFYLVRSVLGLHGDAPSQASRLQVRQVLQDVSTVTNASPYQLCPSFVYDQGLWRGRLFMTPAPPRHSGRDLQAAYEIFMSGPPNVYKVGSVNQASVTWSMYMFMSNYVLWAQNGFSNGAKSGVTTWQSAMASQVSTYCNKKAKAN